MDKRSRHVWEFVATLLGPAIYLGFFGLIYLTNALTCALSRGNSPMIANAQVVLTASAALLALFALLLIAWHATRGLRLLSRERTDTEDNFMGRVTAILAFLSAVAVIWTALPAATVAIAC